MTSATDRRGETTEYTYDLAGNVVQIDRPNKTYTTIEYNDMDQVTKLINYSKGKILSSFQYEYDLSGFIVKEIASQDKEETVTSTYAYDYRCQLVRVRMTTESGPVIEREYAYDKAGNRIMEETTSDGVVIRRVESEYDDASRLISQNIWEDSAPGHSGDKPEKPEKPHTDNGHHYGNDKGDNHIDKKGQQKKEDISSNADNQEAIANNTAELLPPDVYDSGVEAWSGKHDPDQTISYQYDENGNLTEKSGSDIDTFSYQYDNENRLRAVMQNGTILMAALYDGNGDRIFKLQRHSTSSNVPSSEEKKNNGNNKNKDKDKNNGNQGSSTNGDVPVDLALLEDVMLLPTGANKINIESFDLTGYINDVNRQYTQALMEYGKNGKYNSIYSYGLQRLGADYNGAQTVYLYDGRGSMVNETNGSGTSMSAYLYDEWGNLLSGKVHTNGFYSDLFLYNGEATDITTGLQYLRARYYDPEMGRFVQEDTFLGYIQTPLSLNLYIYVQNNPLNYIDPSGNWPWDKEEQIAARENYLQELSDKLRDLSIMSRYTKNPSFAEELTKEAKQIQTEINDLNSQVWSDSANGFVYSPEVQQEKYSYLQRKIILSEGKKPTHCVIKENTVTFRDPINATEQFGYNQAIAFLQDKFYTNLVWSNDGALFSPGNINLADYNYINQTLEVDLQKTVSWLYRLKSVRILVDNGASVFEIVAALKSMDPIQIQEGIANTITDAFDPTPGPGEGYDAFMRDFFNGTIVDHVEREIQDKANSINKLNKSIYRFVLIPTLSQDQLVVEEKRQEVIDFIDEQVELAQNNQINSLKINSKARDFYIDTLLRVRAMNMTRLQQEVLKDMEAFIR